MSTAKTNWRSKIVAAVLFAIAAAPERSSAQEPMAQLTSTEIAWRVDFLKRRGYVDSYAVAGNRVTAVIGAKMRYIPSDDSRRELCSWVLSAHKAQDAAIASARFVDAQGQLLLECAS